MLPTTFMIPVCLGLVCDPKTSPSLTDGPIDVSSDRLSGLASQTLTAALAHNLCPQHAVFSPVADTTVFHVGLMLTTDDGIAAYNRTYRGKAGPTNVLSFPMAEVGQAYPWINDKNVALGDLILSLPTVMTQALQAEKSPQAHFEHLLVHGLLHLLHFDHQNEDEAQVMEGLEVDILAKWGWPNPYTCRSQVDPHQ